MYLTYLKRENNQYWVILKGKKKKAQNYYNAALFSLKPLQAQNGSAYHQGETDLPHLQTADSDRRASGPRPTLVFVFAELKSTLPWPRICPSLFIVLTQSLAEKCIIY